MVNEIYKLFRKNIPYVLRSESKVREILSDADNHIITQMDNNILTAVSVINGNVIYLLCVDKPYRNCGIGTELLSESEAYISANGFDEIILGAGKDYIMPGVPMIKNAHMFFMRRGYEHSWGDCGCFDMELLLDDFTYSEHSVGDTINSISYRWATTCDLDNIINCVQDAAEEFVPYYRIAAYYNGSSESRVLVAENGDEIVGAIHVNVEQEEKGTGSVGCTVTMSKHQGRGIATNMVKLGTKHLKDIGLRRAALGYTYTDIVGMYGRAGYKVSVEYFMGMKDIKGD